MSLSFETVASGAIVHAHAVFPPGAWTVLGSDAIALDQLLALASGEQVPWRGRVTLSGAAPGSVPAARRTVASLRALESLPPARTVSAALELVLAARFLPLQPQQLLAQWQLEAWAGRKPSELSAGEQRTLALAVCLHDSRAALLALFEPLATALPRERVLEALAERARAAIVLAASTSLDDARALGGSWFVLDGGVLAAAGQDAFAIAASTRKAFAVRTVDARKLAAVLASDQAVSAVEWDERLAPKDLRVHGTDAAQLCLAITRGALQHGIALELVAPVVPPLDAVLAARAGLVQSAYESAYRAAQGKAQAMAIVGAPPAAGAAPIFGSPHGGSEYRSVSAPAPENQSLGIPPFPPAEKEREP